MKSYLKYLGIIDKSNKSHFVEFYQGVNIITGKSSTGKSAMIEIFDYCFGSSEFTIPSGIITENTDIYFMVLAIENINIVVGRKNANTSIFLKEESSLPDIKTLTKEYFEEKYFSRNFNVELGHYFGLNINDIDEDESTLELRQQKKGRPSIRNMIPFLLQHQNLIANKHSLFYRFDEKEKREQTIDQFKIFAGLVTQEYYTLKQKLSAEQKKLKKLELEKKEQEKKEFGNKENLSYLLKEYYAITGKELLSDEISYLLLNPGNALKKVESAIESVNYESDESEKQLHKLKKQKNIKEADKRDLKNKLHDISSSIEYAKSFYSDIKNIANEHQETIKITECPFCNKYNETISTEGNNLLSAIDWLNKELSKSTYMLDSFESDKNKVENKINELDNEISLFDSQINKILSISEKLRNNQSLEEQAFKLKLKIESFFEEILDNSSSDIGQNIMNSENLIKQYENYLKEKFDISKKVNEAEKYINNEMESIGEKFDFEESYKPINLHFSLDTFELWHQEQDKKVYLRSMGSGANWLYSHITLFLSLQKYFCSLGNQSLLPSILFFDQPSQVYFPTTIKDNSGAFDIDDVEKRKGTETKDEDLKAVTNLFNQLVSFCKTTLQETGIEPQIIVTDHADDIILDGEVNFETLVNGRRWRNRGFIHDGDSI